MLFGMLETATRSGPNRPVLGTKRHSASYDQLNRSATSFSRVLGHRVGPGSRHKAEPGVITINRNAATATVPVVRFPACV